MPKPILAYLLLGQSNMYGVTTWPNWPNPQPVDNDLLMLNPADHLDPPVTEFPVAVEPLHAWAAPGGRETAGTGPGMRFGEIMRERYPHLRFLLLATARPSSIYDLEPGHASGYYEETLTTALLAQSLGAEIAGILTHHGELNTGAGPSAAGWDEQYISVVNHFRADLGVPDLAAVHAQLGNVDPNVIPGDLSNWDTVKASQWSVTLDRLPRSARFKTDDFHDVTFDGLHFKMADTIIEATRFADAIEALGHPLFAEPRKLFLRMG